MKGLIPGFDFERVEKVVEFILSNSTRGDAVSVIKAIDDYPDQRLHLGQCKSSHIEKLFAERKPKVLAELGGFIGSSAIRLGLAAREQNPLAHYYTIELNPILACVIESLVKQAGLSETVTVLQGDLRTNLPTLKNKIRNRFKDVDHLDFLLLDHGEEFYIPDLKLAQAEGLVQKGSVVVADNILKPGAPDYRKYMETETELYSSKLQPILEGAKQGDAILVSMLN